MAAQTSSVTAKRSPARALMSGPPRAAAEPQRRDEEEGAAEQGVAGHVDQRRSDVRGHEEERDPTSMEIDPLIIIAGPASAPVGCKLLRSLGS